VIPGNDDALRAIRLFTTKIADSAYEGVQMISETAFAAETADVTPTEIPSEFIGEDGEFDPAAVHESAGLAAASSEDLVEEDDNVDLAAVLGGNIRKAPVAAVDEEPEAEPAHATGA